MTDEEKENRPMVPQQEQGVERAASFVVAEVCAAEALLMEASTKLGGARLKVISLSGGPGPVSNEMHNLVGQIIDLEQRVSAKVRETALLIDPAPPQHREGEGE